uniref:Uncharacterized protein n=1 Tax=Arundo donax TaxID=35708 RepID=A0A0A9CAX8_ARUDO
MVTCLHSYLPVRSLSLRDSFSLFVSLCYILYT